MVMELVSKLQQCIEINSVFFTCATFRCERMRVAFHTPTLTAVFITLTEAK